MKWAFYRAAVDVLPLAPPGVRHAANYGAEHESSDEREEHKVDEALQSIITQTCHGLDVVLQQGEGTDFIVACINTSVSTFEDLKLFDKRSIRSKKLELLFLTFSMWIVRGSFKCIRCDFPFKVGQTNELTVGKLQGRQCSFTLAWKEALCCTLS